MKNLSLKNIEFVCKGTLYNGEGKEKIEVTDVVIDSRKISEGALFVPIRGNRVDGHDFIPDVMEQGALCTLSEHRLNIDTPYILVESTTKALMELAAFYRSSLNIKVIGITGSVGKTSTKEMIASVLGAKYTVLKTEGNYNNEIGLPLTIFRLNETHQAAVLEMGISHFGDMAKLAAIARPDICVITNIGLCHLEYLIDRDGVLKAKTEVFAYMPDDGQIVLNGDDDKLANITSYKKMTPVFYGTGKHCRIFGSDIAALGLKGTFFTMNFMNGEELDIYIRIPGVHMVYNAMAAAAVGELMGMMPEEIKKGIEKIQGVKGRNHVIETGRFTIIDDCYNANPGSMKAAIDVLTYGHGRKVAILGDMFELGENEVAMHREIGIYATEKKIDYLICIGKLGKHIFEAGVEHGIHSADYFETKEEFLEVAEKLLKKGDNVLIKASHGMDFPEIVEKVHSLR